MSPHALSHFLAQLLPESGGDGGHDHCYPDGRGCAELCSLSRQHPWQVANKGARSSFFASTDAAEIHKGSVSSASDPLASKPAALIRTSLGPWNHDCSASDYSASAVQGKIRGCNARNVSFMTQVERRALSERKAADEKLNVDSDELGKAKSYEKQEARLVKKREDQLKHVKKGRLDFGKAEAQKKALSKELKAEKKELHKRHVMTTVKGIPVKRDDLDVQVAKAAQFEAAKHAQEIQKMLCPKSDQDEYGKCPPDEEEKKLLTPKNGPGAAAGQANSPAGGLLPNLNFPQEEEEKQNYDDCGCIVDGPKMSGWNPDKWECSRGQEGQVFENNICNELAEGPRIMKPFSFEVENGYIKVNSEKLATSGKPLMLVVATHEEPPATTDARPPLPFFGSE